MNPDVRELCRLLKPLIGPRADRYWRAYLAQDPPGRQELETALRLTAARLLKDQVDRTPIHLTPPPPKLAQGPYPLGNVLYADQPTHPFGLREDELIQHTAVFGRSGAGKTNTVLQLLHALLARNKPFLIFDWKRNYRDLLAVRNEPLTVYTVGRPAAPFAFNPLIPPDGTDPAVWLKKIIEIIAHAYYLGEGVMFLLQEAIHAEYHASGLYRGTPDRYPTFHDVLKRLHDCPVKGRQALWMDSAMRGIKSICFGHMGAAVTAPKQPRLAPLLQRNAVLELDGLSNADKTLVTEALLLWIHHYRLTQPDRETFKHALIIEEAHHILRKQAAAGPEPITETVLREIRELGEAVILVDQHPSLMSIPALGNTYTTITMNLKHRSDVNAVAAAMLMNDDDRDLLGRLAVGEAVVKLQGRWPEPFQLRIPHRPLPKGAVRDEELARLQNPAEGSQPEPPSAPAHASARAPDPREAERQNALLVDVAQHPLSGVVERYRRIGLSRRKGNAAKDACIRHGLLESVEINTGTGRVLLLQLTPHGRTRLPKGQAHAPHEPLRGGLEHEYWKRRTADALARAGFAVTVEEPVNGYTDLTAQADGVRIAVEIETGKSDWRANLAKNLRKGFDRIIIAASNEDALRAVRSAPEARNERVWTCMAWELAQTPNNAISGR